MNYEISVGVPIYNEEETIPELFKELEKFITKFKKVALSHNGQILFVNGRPAFGQPGSTVDLFRLDPDSDLARRVPVKLGRASVSVIEIAQGLKPGDKVILSDTSAWDDTTASASTEPAPTPRLPATRSKEPT